jgi:UDP-GlcNAc3NAcA epimerase
MIKIATIIGARPQFIKAATVSRAIKEANEIAQNVEEIIIHTGQHYDSNMSDIFFQEMEICPPNYNLGIGGLSQGAMTGRMIESVEKVLSQEKPDCVLVYGDTNSTLAGALAAVKMHIPVAHVEAGLRSFNRRMPEEINRILTDQCSDLLFTPSNVSTQQLITEGISRDKIFQFGDVMYDAAIYYQTKAQSKSSILEKLKLQTKNYALVTIHRAENTDDPNCLKEIILGLNAISKYIVVVFPLHPRTKLALEQQDLLKIIQQNVVIIDPVGYLDMIHLEANSKIILTDSGGVQKEAYFFKVPCLTLRAETEWIELVQNGFNKLVPINHEEILKNFLAIHDNLEWNKSLYGQGTAANDIVCEIIKRKK